jgi:ABC-type transport system involved in multi-copper enzyme maturation permease subunit
MMRTGGPIIAKDAWMIGVALQAIFLWLLCPSLASNSITQEKEQQTWEMLVFTRLTPSQIVLGKLVARLIPALFLAALFMPFMLFCLAIGGATIGLAMGTYACLAVWALFCVTLSMFFSWVSKRTATAISLSYVAVFMLAIGTYLLESTLGTGGQPNETALTAVNPIRLTYLLTSGQTEPNANIILFMSSVFFVVVSVFLLWRMQSRFRAFAVD